MSYVAWARQQFTKLSIGLDLPWMEYGSISDAVPHEPQGTYDNLFKVLMVGDASVGKSHLIWRFVNHDQDDAAEPSILYNRESRYTDMSPVRAWE